MHSSYVDTPLGQMVAIADENALYLLEFVDCKDLAREMHFLKKKTGVSTVSGQTAIIRSIQHELRQYFAGTLSEFKTPLTLLGTSFQQSVWQMLQKIPFGTTGSYAQVAQEIGKPTAFRAVANANRNNLLSIVVPCHRIIKSNGDLCGYAGGIARKQWLLDHERAQYK